MDQTINQFIKNKKAIVVEDEAAIAQLLKINLQQLGFEVDTRGDAESALALLKSSNYDLCLLDWMLPGMQGVDFLKKIKPIYKNLKVMMVTAKADADSIVMGFDSGADEYLAKPFDAKVLAARVRHLMRRLQSEQAPAKSEISDTFVYDELSVNFSKHIVLHQNREIHLTPSEFKLMEALIKAQGVVLTREQLIDLIQGEDVSVTGRTIDTHVFALRKKIGQWSKYIETIRGVGYRILISLSDTSEPEEAM
jgi:two-component system phosphate regulon response regulator PhoB